VGSVIRVIAVNEQELQKLRQLVAQHIERQGRTPPLDAIEQMLANAPTMWQLQALREIAKER
jgi:hypothetical protein